MDALCEDEFAPRQRGGVVEDTQVDTSSLDTGWSEDL